jgi:hypothetical protein
VKESTPCLPDTNDVSSHPQGANAITPNGEMIFYGIVDLLAKPVFCIYHCMAIQKCDYRRLGLVRPTRSSSRPTLTPSRLQNSGKYSETSTIEENAFHHQAGNVQLREKVIAHEAAPVVAADSSPATTVIAA